MNGSAYNNWSILKDKPFVTPEMFGAVGDGVTDDSSAIQAAVDTGLAVVFEPKTYRCAEITTNKSVTWIGTNDTVIQTISISPNTNQFRNVLTVIGNSENLEEIQVEISGIHFKGLGAALTASTTNPPFPTLLKFDSCNVNIHDNSFSSLYTKNRNKRSVDRDQWFGIFHTCIDCTEVEIDNNEFFDSGDEELTWIWRRDQNFKNTYKFINNDIQDIHGWSFDANAEIIHFSSNKIQRFNHIDTSVTNFNATQLFCSNNYVVDSVYTQLFDGCEGGYQTAKYTEIENNYVDSPWGGVLAYIQSIRVSIRNNFHVGRQALVLQYWDSQSDCIPESTIIENNHFKTKFDPSNTRTERQCINALSNASSTEFVELYELIIRDNIFDLSEYDNVSTRGIMPCVIQNTSKSVIERNTIIGKPIDGHISGSIGFFTDSVTNNKNLEFKDNILKSDNALSTNTYISYTGVNQTITNLLCINNQILNGSNYSLLRLQNAGDFRFPNIQSYRLDFQLYFNNIQLYDENKRVIYSQSKSAFSTIQQLIQNVRWTDSTSRLNIIVDVLETTRTLPSGNLGTVEISKQSDNLFLTFRDTQANVYTCTYVNNTWSSWKQVSLV